jgi:hypothetical protein
MGRRLEAAAPLQPERRANPARPSRSGAGSIPPLPGCTHPLLAESVVALVPAALDIADQRQRLRSQRLERRGARPRVEAQQAGRLLKEHGSRGPAAAAAAAVRCASLLPVLLLHVEQGQQHVCRVQGGAEVAAAVCGGWEGRVARLCQRAVHGSKPRRPTRPARPMDPRRSSSCKRAAHLRAAGRPRATPQTRGALGSPPAGRARQAAARTAGPSPPRGWAAAAGAAARRRRRRWQLAARGLRRGAGACRVRLNPQLSSAAARGAAQLDQAPPCPRSAHLCL